MSHRIIRNYHGMGPTKFHGFNQAVRKALADKSRFPDSIWVGASALLLAYFAASDKHDSVYHESMLGSKLVIAERQVLQAQLVLYLDQIASLLEMAAVVNPDILLASGFELSKDRRVNRAKAAVEALSAAVADQKEGGSGTAS